MPRARLQAYLVSVPIPSPLLAIHAGAPRADCYGFARSPGHAARKAFRRLIAMGALTRQPRSTNEGGWEGVSITRAPQLATSH